jgi:protein-tyrosine kinase
MSRIDQALEKAARLRDVGLKTGYAQASGESRKSIDAATFLVGQGAVKRETVDHHIVTIADPSSHVAEEFKKLRARVLRNAEKESHNTLLITSAQAGEGKTITAINLAVAVAQELDRTVLLIDADLRKPTIHTYLGLEPSRGLSDYLLSRANLSDILIKTGIGKLVVLPAGNPPDNPAELLGSQRMRDLVRDVKERYRDRYIIMDAPPLLMAADAISLANYVDDVLFVVQAGTTTQKIANQALALIKECNVIGSVFNNIPNYLVQNLNPYYTRYNLDKRNLTAKTDPEHTGQAGASD